MKDLEYQECASCAAKSGAPELCPICLHNRAVVDTLKAELENVKKERDILQASLEARQEKSLQELLGDNLSQE